VKLSAWAKQQGICYQTAWEWFRDGKLPVPAEQMATGTILVYPPAETSRNGGSTKVALYARVSSADQAADLDRQLGRLAVFASARGLSVVSSVTEVGSGLNGHRPKLTRLLQTPSVDVIVVEHRDRLCLFGFEYLEAALKAQGRSFLVVETNEIESDLVRDMTEVLTSLCARLYGKRSAKRRAEKALTAAAGQA
jgi:putative resolvase